MQKEKEESGEDGLLKQIDDSYQPDFKRVSEVNEVSSRVCSSSSLNKHPQPDEKRRMRILTHFEEFRSGRSSLVVLDGELKSLTVSVLEQDGMLVEEQSIKSLDLSQLEEEEEEMENEEDEVEKKKEEDITDQLDLQVKQELKLDEFLDLMEIF
ncbi:uncharacterized protein LOC111711420 [Eurytemora carolleeae]|uniref:uncharacterized protein LOC111711420 n=1 Tax=Eurytemora carolleeae TaxID=1294199 RepID=UPI000C75BBCB|nr:uncharacterized protein LOC111711420 [Eurytemora carolleeae]|eukprot:XP_023341551.1 uncharacterized protein LOC111711420 [Eurytemora affinis]